ncbi:hypothetical protein D3C71_2095660 [compost metagenome]
MILQPGLGDLQLPRGITAAQQAVQTCQMAVVLTLERRAQDLFGLDLGTELTQLLGVSQHQLRLLALSGSQLLPGAVE